MRNIAEPESAQQYFRSLCEPASVSVEWTSCSAPCRVKQAAPTLETSSSKCSRKTGASLRCFAVCKNTTTIKWRGEGKADSEKGEGERGQDIHKPVRWTMRCRFNTEKDEMQTARSKAMRDSEWHHRRAVEGKKEKFFCAKQIQSSLFCVLTIIWVWL